MNYCSAHFGKKLDEVTYQDVVDFFTTEKTETDQIEFKSFAGTLNDDTYAGLKRTICAFLNSKGGLLIWGAPAGVRTAGRTEKIFQGNLTPINQILPKDPLISTCSDSITPLPSGLRVSIIKDGNNGCVCIFEVDESNYSPHQFDKTFLMRIDGQNKPAPYHYVEALFKKIRYPNLEGFLKILAVNRSGTNPWRISFRLIFFNWSPLQNEENFSFRMIVAPGWFGTHSVPVHFGAQGDEITKENHAAIFRFGEPLTEQHVLNLSPSTLGEDLKVEMVLTLGGRFSPAKACVYSLDLSNPSVGANPDSLLSVISENELIKDVQDQKGVTRGSTLKSFGIVR